MSYERRNLPALLSQIEPQGEGPRNYLKPVTRNPLAGILRGFGDAFAIDSLNGQANIIAAAARVVDAQTTYVQAEDRRCGAMEQFQRNRLGILNPADEERVKEEEHKREMAELHREKERLDAERAALEAERQALDARHGLEAAEEFKDDKFRLGRVRAAARRKDAEVDKSTAEAALRKLAGEPRQPKKSGASVDGALDALIRTLEEAVRQGDTDGEETGDLHAELRAVKRLKGTL